MIRIFTLLVCLGVATLSWAQSFHYKNRNHKEPFITNIRLEAGPYYQMDNVMLNRENVRFKSYGLHFRTRYSFDEIIQFSFGGNIYKSEYWYANNAYEISAYGMILLNPLHSLLKKKTSFFNTVQPLIGLGMEGDTFLGRKNKWYGTTINASISYITYFITLEFAYKNRVWVRNSQQNILLPDKELSSLSTISILFNFMSWTKHLTKRRKKVKSAFFDKGW